MNRRDFFRIAGWGLLGTLFPGVAKEGLDYMPIGDMLLKLAEGKPLSTGEKDSLRLWGNRTEMANAYVAGLDTAGVSPNVDGLNARRLEVRDRMLIGSALSGKPNLYYDSVSGQLQFRTGTTVMTYISTGGLRADGARVTRIANQSIATSTATPIQFSAEDYDDSGFVDLSGDSTKITIPAGRDGRYLVSFSVVASTTETNVVEAAVRKNNSALSVPAADQKYNPSTYGSAFLSGAAQVDLVATDYLTLVVAHYEALSINFSQAALEINRIR